MRTTNHVANNKSHGAMIIPCLAVFIVIIFHYTLGCFCEWIWLKMSRRDQHDPNTSLYRPCDMLAIMHGFAVAAATAAAIIITIAFRCHIQPVLINQTKWIWYDCVPQARFVLNFKTMCREEEKNCHQIYFHGYILKWLLHLSPCNVIHFFFFHSNCFAVVQ